MTSNLRQQIEAELREERLKEIEKIKAFELEEFLGRLLIVVSNEVDNLLVGYGKEIIHITQASVPMLVVHDIVNKRDVMPGGIILCYTEQKFNALNRLDPNERIAIYYNKAGQEEINKNHLIKEEVFPSDVWSQKVHAAIEEFNANKNQGNVKKIKP